VQMPSAVDNIAACESPSAVHAPWEVNQSRLVSWFDMLYFSAYMFFWCGHALRRIKTDCLLGSIPGSGEEPMFHLARELDDVAREKAKESLKHVEDEFRKVGMKITADTVKELSDALEEISPGRNFQWLMDQVSVVEKLAQKELTGKVFLFVPPEQAKYFPTRSNPYPFTEKVSRAFPSATYDTNEAAWSLATLRSTAAVFHLMRVLEIALGVLGKVFGVSLLHTNWAPALDQIEARIREMHKDPVWKALPDCKEQQEFYAQAASHFGVLKDAWRNYTMHVRAKYTEEEAEQIFANVKSFMQKLAERLCE
jgi:hypothetical protein